MDACGDVGDAWGLGQRRRWSDDDAATYYKLTKVNRYKHSMWLTVMGALNPYTSVATVQNYTQVALRIKYRGTH